MHTQKIDLTTNGIMVPKFEGGHDDEECDDGTHKDRLRASLAVSKAMAIHEERENKEADEQEKAGLQ